MAGLYLEEFEVGMTFEHATRRTVTETDNVIFTSMTHNLAPLHLDAEYAKTTIYGQRLMNSMYVLALLGGICMQDTTHGTTLGNLGFEDVKFPRPVFAGDTLRIRTEVISVRESNSREDSGIVIFRHQAINQRGEIVCDCRRAGLMLKRSWVDQNAATS